MKTSRRNFIKGSGLMAGSAIVPLSFTLPSKAFANTNDDDGYKALVCVQLKGGNDSFNMMIPKSAPHHSDYRTMRPMNGFDVEQLLDIEAITDNGVELGLNPNMPNLKALYDNGLAAALINVGTLHEPTTKETLPIVTIPSSLGSHTTQREQWEKSYNRNLGCGGQTMDFFYDESALLPEAIYTGAGNWYRGVETPTLNISSGSSFRMDALDSSADLYDIFADLIEQDESSPFGQEINHRLKEMLKLQDDVSDILNNVPEDDRIISTGRGLGAQLRTVKKFIESAPLLGHKRQIFYVTIGGYDSHGSSNNNALTSLDQQLCSFINALHEDGLDKAVTTFTMSDFGRTINENSRGGTDHGWGGIQLILGGSVKGGAVYGDYPTFHTEGNDAYGRKFIPTIAHEQMAATLGKWFGLTTTSIDYIHPILNPNNDNPFPSRVMDFMHGIDVDNPDGTEKELSITEVYASHEHTDYATGIKQVAEMAIDGNVETKWSGKGLGVLFEASLATPSKMTKLRFRMPRTDTRQYKYVVDVVDQNGVEYPVTDLALTPLTDSEYDWFEVQITANNVMKVRLTYFGNTDSQTQQYGEFAGIAELELWGVN